MNAVKSFLIVSDVVLVSISVTECRDPFNVLMSPNFICGKVPTLFDVGLYLGAIKESGPSGPGDQGHKQILGGIKNSGPNPGVGRNRTLGGIKNSGPSPGEGHSSIFGGVKNSGSNRLTVSINLGGINDFGPSPGVGNKFTDSRTRTHGDIKDSGPSPGVGNCRNSLSGGPRNWASTWIKWLESPPTTLKRI
ncbi:putative UDP-glucosyl transferase 84B2 [Hibiscus syriacus]|uniref:UDP-glucosyl transferase 84B2 n=1 Tax=Hibiscus syriacus TaxID=106335 RepID=A0A6A3BNM5_HIBSY|nr:putative UDP-glucosyl transferase 84B2 [Hibiscus syriacus]